MRRAACEPVGVGNEGGHQRVASEPDHPGSFASESGAGAAHSRVDRGRPLAGSPRARVCQRSSAIDAACGRTSGPPTHAACSSEALNVECRDLSPYVVSSTGLTPYRPAPKHRAALIAALNGRKRSRSVPSCRPNGLPRSHDTPRVLSLDEISGHEARVHRIDSDGVSSPLTACRHDGPGFLIARAARTRTGEFAGLGRAEPWPNERSCGSSRSLASSGYSARWPRPGQRSGQVHDPCLRCQRPPSARHTPDSYRPCLRATAARGPC